MTYCNSHLRLVKFPVELVDKNGFSALTYARIQGHTGIVRWFEEREEARREEKEGKEGKETKSLS
jgi:hypothetical protein